ncbi:MAG: cyclic nucleotide-binding domain-containing protein [Gammaproteobacteria bacterium]|nr:cyclic nucleotide-binding domain-containing protein [Gammaproteobacteria bacterium]
MLSKGKIVKYGEGKMLFKRNDEDSFAYWLLSGAVDLVDEKFEAKNRTAEDEASKFPIDNNNPHRLTAVTTVETRMLQVDRAESGLFDSGDEGETEAESDEDEEIDWMEALLSSPLFEFIPPTNIQTLFSKFEEVEYETGEAVIRQGEPGDFFYVIQSGRAKVERKSGDKVAVLAELGPGDNFGQDALISDVPRNATVTMTRRGTLMRLSEEDFESLLMRPLIETITMDETKEMIDQGDPQTYILDVRSQSEVEQDKISGAINVPLLSLRKNLAKLKPEAVYVCACDGSHRRELAAYILNENGFTGYVLEQEKAGKSVESQSNSESEANE